MLLSGGARRQRGARGESTIGPGSLGEDPSATFIVLGETTASSPHRLAPRPSSLVTALFSTILFTIAAAVCVLAQLMILRAFAAGRIPGASPGAARFSVPMMVAPSSIPRAMPIAWRLHG